MATTKKYVSIEKLGLYDSKIKKVISDGDAATLASAQEFASGLASNYDAAGAAATAEANAKAYADGKDTAIQAAQKAADDAAAVASVADGKAVAAQGDVDALETYVGTFTHDTAKTVVEYINAKTEGIATSGNLEALAGRVTTAETDIDNIKKDYLKAADKTELEGKITTAQAAADAAQAHSEGVAGDLAEAVEALEGADASQIERIAALEGTIVGLSGAMHFEGVKNEVPTDVTGYEQGDVIIVGNKEYVLNGDAFVEFGDASVNAEAITTLTGRVSTLETDMGTAKTDIDNVEAAVATKAEQSALDTAIEALEGADEAQVERIAALEAKFGGAEGSVEDMIADAKQEAIEAAGTNADTKDASILTQAKNYADDEDAKIEARVDALETASETHALASDVTALTGRVTTAEGKITTLEGEMDAVEALAAANKSAHEANAAAIALKADTTALNAVSDRVTAVETWQANMLECSEEDVNNLFA